MKSNARLAVLLITVLCGLAGPALAATNLVRNGSFEADPAPNAYWTITETLTGWQGDPATVDGRFGGIELQNQGFENLVAQDGANWVELDTYRNSWMTQTVQATGWVELSFWYAARPGWAAGTQDLGFSLGSLKGTVLQGVAGGSTLQWQHYVGRVDLGSSGSAVLRFEAQGLSDMAGGLLDNVSVTAVPEPATTALWLAGLGLVAVARSRSGARRISAR